MASRANSFYRCPSNNEATNSFAFPVNEVLSARLPRHAQQPRTPERAGSPVSRRNVADRRLTPTPTSPKSNWRCLDFSLEARHDMWPCLVYFLALAIPPAVSAFGRGKLFQSSKNVYELEAAGVENDVANSRSPWVVMYYADWCPHCHHYAPSFERIAQKVSPSHVGPVQFGALNCPDFMAFCTKIQIPGYPSVRTYHFKGDVGHALSGSRPDRDMVHDEKKFVAWLQRNAPEDNVTLSEPAEETTKEPKVGVRGAKQASTNSDSDSNRVLPRSGRSKVLQEAMPALHLADAEVAVLYSLRQGVFLQGESGTLQGPPLAELMSWLDYLGRVFPGGGHRPVAKLSDALHEAVASADDKLSVEAFEKLMDNRGLDRIPPEAGLKPNAFWRHCQGFTCGLWTLFHLLSQAAKSTSSESAGEELLLRVRGFVENFFGCGYCREHFLEAFDGCKLERCSLAKDDLDGAALWLWKMHNDVTLRVAKEDGREIPSPWPSAEDCEECWICQDCWKKGSRSDDDFKRAAILAYLRQEFSSPEWHEERHWLSGDFSANRAMPLAAVSALLLAAAALRCLRSGRGEDARGKDAKDS